MGVDHVLAFDCATKRALGDGDATAGSWKLVELLKARARLELVEGIARKEGRPAGDLSLTHVVITPDGPQQQAESTDALRERIEPLAGLGAACEGCAANVSGDAFGCVGYLSYPVPRRSEQWILDQLQPGDEFGGFVMLRALDDFGYSGEPIDAMRARGLFESEQALQRAITDRHGTQRQVRSSQVLEALFAVGDALQPFHCALVLQWLGLLWIDGEPPRALDDPRPLIKLQQAATTAERRALTELALDSPGDDPALYELCGLMRALYAAFVLECSLLVSV
ncbi:MAG: hypothetical protein JXR96_20165 [Deltaproteobacteria bacterium]|nr:hypothetical protein [Deltaproteobacteria bacterium]